MQGVALCQEVPLNLMFQNYFEHIECEALDVRGRKQLHTHYTQFVL